MSKMIKFAVPVVVNPPRYILPPGAVLVDAPKNQYKLNGQTYQVLSGSAPYGEDYGPGVELNGPDLVYGAHLPAFTGISENVGRTGGTREDGGLTGRYVYDDGTVRSVEGVVLQDRGALGMQFDQRVRRLPNGSAFPGNDTFTAFRITKIPLQYSREAAAVEFDAFVNAGIPPFANRFDAKKDEFDGTVPDWFGGFGGATVPAPPVVNGAPLTVAVTAPTDRTAQVDPRYDYVFPAVPGSREAAGRVTAEDIAAVTPFQEGGGTSGFGGQNPVLYNLPSTTGQGINEQGGEILVTEIGASGQPVNTLESSNAVANATGSNPNATTSTKMPTWAIAVAAGVLLLLVLKEK